MQGVLWHPWIRAMTMLIQRHWEHLLRDADQSHAFLEIWQLFSSRATATSATIETAFRDCHLNSELLSSICKNTEAFWAGTSFDPSPDGSVRFSSTDFDASVVYSPSGGPYGSVVVISGVSSASPSAGADVSACGSEVDSSASAVSAGGEVAVYASPSAGAVVSAFGSTDLAFEVVLVTEEVLLPASSNDRVAGESPPSMVIFLLG